MHPSSSILLCQTKDSERLWWWSAGSTMDKSPVHRRTNTETDSHTQSYLYTILESSLTSEAWFRIVRGNLSTQRGPLHMDITQTLHWSANLDLNHVRQKWLRKRQYSGLRFSFFFKSYLTSSIINPLILLSLVGLVKNDRKVHVFCNYC